MLNGRFQSIQNLFDRADAIDACEFSLQSVMPGNGSRLGVVDINALLNDPRICIIRPAASFCATKQALLQLVFFDFQGEHARHRCFSGIQKSIQSLCLRCGARKTIKNKSFGVGVLVDLRLQHTNGHIVWNELALVHERLGFLSELRVALDV